MKLKPLFIISFVVFAINCYSQSPQPGDIIISEIMYKANGQGYVELYNTTNTSFTFEASIVAGVGSTNTQNMGTITIGPKSFYIISRGTTITTDYTANSSYFMERGLDYESFILYNTDQSPWVQLSEATLFGMTGTSANYGKSLELVHTKNGSGAEPGEFSGSDYAYSTSTYADGDGSPYALGSTHDPATVIDIIPSNLQVNENAFSTTLALQITDPDLQNQMTVDLSLITGDSSQIGHFENTILQIPAGTTSFSYTLNFFDNNFVNEDRNFIFQISNPSGGYYPVINQDKFYLTILDDDLNYVGFNNGWLSPNGTQQGIYIDTVTNKVGIGTAELPGQYLLYVKEGIRAEKLRVDVANDNGWADFVFENDYELMSLEELKKFIAKEKHLPNVPSSSEVVADGVDVAEINAILLRKIEELTLYLIEKDQQIRSLEKQVKKLRK